jgi:hypothetical protein
LSHSDPPARRCNGRVICRIGDGKLPFGHFRRDLRGSRCNVCATAQFGKRDLARDESPVLAFSVHDVPTIPQSAFSLTMIVPLIVGLSELPQCCFRRLKWRRRDTSSHVRPVNGVNLRWAQLGPNNLTEKRGQSLAGGSPLHQPQMVQEHRPPHPRPRSPIDHGPATCRFSSSYRCCGLAGCCSRKSRLCPSAPCGR